MVELPPPTWINMHHLGQKLAFIKQLLVDPWQQPYLYAGEIKEFRPNYNVPGRRKNGSLAGRHRIRWFFGEISVFLQTTILNFTSIFTSAKFSKYRRHTISGSEGSSALRFADSNFKDRQQKLLPSLWLAWSPNHAVLLKAVYTDKVSYHQVWSSEPGNAPIIDPEKRTMRWRDGSSLTFGKEFWNWCGRADVLYQQGLSSKPSPDPPWSELKYWHEEHAYVHKLAIDTWHHPYLQTASIREFRPIYRVSGRRRNGSFVGKHRIRWFFGRILLPVRDIVLTVISLGSNYHFETYRRHIVTGPANCSALRFADTNSKEQQRQDVEPLWLVWSPNHAVLLKVIDEDTTYLQEVWSSERGDAPIINPAERTIQWRDGSAITLDKGHCTFV